MVNLSPLPHTGEGLLVILSAAKNLRSEESRREENYPLPHKGGGLGLVRLLTTGY